MSKFSFFGSFIFSLLLIVNCKTAECKSSNAVFDKFSPNTKEYKDELIKQLSKENKAKLTYWMSAYWKENSKTGTPLEHIQVHLKSESICADMILVITNSRKGIETILKNQILGYKGAELVNLQFDVVQDSLHTEFIFREIDGIKD